LRFFQLVSSRYEHASTDPHLEPALRRWGDVFGDSYRLKDAGIDTLPSARADITAQ
jgi:hypothetical protein